MYALCQAIGFNTQPPEGGWARNLRLVQFVACFNTQPPEGGWGTHPFFRDEAEKFQHTAARRRLVPLFVNGIFL